MNEETVFTQKFFSDPSTPHYGFIILKDNNGWFHSLESGEPAYPQRYLTVEHFQKGKKELLAWVRKEDKTYVAINEQGQEIKCEHALPF